MALLVLTTYAGLQDAVARWLNREDLTDEIPGFIAMAEVAFNREIRWRKMVVRDLITDPGLTDELYENLPDDFLELKSLRFNTDPVIYPEYLTPRQLEKYRGDHPGAAGTPLHYTIVANQIQFDRVPTGAPELEISAYVQVPPLTAAAPTNQLLLEYPDVYLYGTLLQASPFLHDDERVRVWADMYTRAIGRLEKSDKMAERSPGPMTITSGRVF